MSKNTEFEKTLFIDFPLIADLLLIDNTTKKNIIWATNSYRRNGLHFEDYINNYYLLKRKLIIPRVQKTKYEKNKRSKDSAEVFTPSWMCNRQNNLIDEQWFKKKNLFNTEIENGWLVNENPIPFTSRQNWMDYIRDLRLEISCGEAPYVVNRYDSVSGERIDLKNRIGLLDRKFRVINENSQSDEEWIDASLIALKSVYGYEWQGDNLLLARENVLFSYIDYYIQKFGKIPDENLLIEVTKIISWNFWQMDGLKCVIPNSCKKEKICQIKLFGEDEITNNECKGCYNGSIYKHNGIYSKIMDWEKNKKITYVSVIRGGFRYE